MYDLNELKVCGVVFKTVGIRRNVFGLGHISSYEDFIAECQESIVYRSSHQLSVIKRFSMTA